MIEASKFQSLRSKTLFTALVMGLVGGEQLPKNRMIINKKIEQIFHKIRDYYSN